MIDNEFNYKMFLRDLLYEVIAFTENKDKAFKLYTLILDHIQTIMVYSNANTNGEKSKDLMQFCEAKREFDKCLNLDIDVDFINKLHKFITKLIYSNNKE